VNPSKSLEGDAQGWLRSKEQGSISSGGASQCLFAGENEVTFHQFPLSFHAFSFCCTDCIIMIHFSSCKQIIHILFAMSN